MRGLGNVIDLAIGVNNAALTNTGVTGKRLHLANYQTVDFALITGPASAGTDTVVLTLQQHTLAAAGSSSNLAAIGDVYYKSTAAALTGTEAWTFFDNTTGGNKQATLSLTNAGFLPAANAGIITFSVEADSLDAGFGWISLSYSGLTSTNTRPATLLYVPSGLKLMREPALLAQPNL